jgi:hypothetical protein
VLPFVLVVSAFVLWRGTRAPRWREIVPGLEFAIFHGDPYCRRGSAAIAVLRMDPERVRLRVHHYTQGKDFEPPDVVQWQRRTKALAVFNAGQFYPDWKYMGLLASGGSWLSRKAHVGYHAVLVADRHGPGEGAHVLDLASISSAPESLAWNEVAQSFMLFDSTGTLRVRRSERIANRTIVGEDDRGRIVVLVSEGSYTLADLAFVIQKSTLRLRHAMSMDGGREAELVVSHRGFRYASFGRWSSDDEHPEALGARVPLPAVITLEAPK